MRSSTRLPALLLGVFVLSSVAACHPYGDELQGEFSAGSADPFNYPPFYRSSSGGGFTREVAGTGSFFERKAAAHGAAATANYFAFPFPPSLVSTTGYAAVLPAVDPLRLGAAPLAYEFDPTDPVTDSLSCTAPANYTYDPYVDEARLDRQGNLVSSLPNATFGGGSLPSWTYIPVVQRVTVTSNGEACQGPKSDALLFKHTDVNVPIDSVPNADGSPKVIPDPVYLAWATIDPGSGVYRVGQTAANSPGLDVQHWGWYRQFLSAYLDGGPIPTTGGGATPLKMVSQDLYYPRSGATAGNSLGGGNDLLQFVRGEAGSSPVCKVSSYIVPAARAGVAYTDVAALLADPAAAATVQAGAPVSATGNITPTYIFCLQAR